MCSELWRLIILVPLVFYYCDAAKCEINEFPTDSQPCSRSEETYVPNDPINPNNLFKNAPAEKRNDENAIADGAKEIAKAQSVDEMIKRMELFSRKFPAKLLKDKSLKPMTGKFKKNFDTLLKNARPILQMARKLQKLGRRKTKKQSAEFALKLKTLQKHIDDFAKSVNSESRKQKNRNLKIIESQPNDISVLENAKRFIGVADIISGCVQWIQSIPSSVNCFIFGNCEASNGNVDGDTSDNQDDDEEEEEDDDEDGGGDDGDDGDDE